MVLFNIKKVVGGTVVLFNGSFYKKVVGGSF